MSISSESTPEEVYQAVRAWLECRRRRQEQEQVQADARRQDNERACPCTAHVLAACVDDEIDSFHYIMKMSFLEICGTPSLLVDSSHWIFIST